MLNSIKERVKRDLTLAVIVIAILLIFYVVKQLIEN